MDPMGMCSFIFGFIFRNVSILSPVSIKLTHRKEQSCYHQCCPLMNQIWHDMIRYPHFQWIIFPKFPIKKKHIFFKDIPWRHSFCGLHFCPQSIWDVGSNPTVGFPSIFPFTWNISMKYQWNPHETTIKKTGFPWPTNHRTGVPPWAGHRQWSSPFGTCRRCTWPCARSRSQAKSWWRLVVGWTTGWCPIVYPLVN